MSYRTYRIATVIAALLSLLAGGCGNKDQKKKPAARTSAADAGASKARRKLAPRVLWRTPYRGRLRTLALGNGALLVTSRYKSHRSRTSRVAAFSLTDGQLLWHRSLWVRYFEMLAPWAVSMDRVDGTLAVAKSNGHVEALDFKTGHKLWTIKGRHGVAALGDSFLIGHDDRLLLVTRSDGAVAKEVDLGSTAGGGHKTGLMADLVGGSMLIPVPAGAIVTRSDGGALQRFRGRGASLTPGWRFFVEGTFSQRPARIVRGESTLLFPVLAPSKMMHTRLTAWQAGLGAKTPRWRAEVPGFPRRKMIFRIGTTLIGVSPTTNKTVVMWRLDALTGKVLGIRPFPDPRYCFLAGTRLACRLGKRITAFDPETLEPAWTYAPPEKRYIASARITEGGERVAAATAGLLVMEIGHGEIVAINLADGTPAFTAKALHDKKRYVILDVLGQVGDRVLLYARIDESSPFGDRVYLLALDAKTGATVGSFRLGRYPRRPPAWKQDDPKERLADPAVFLVRGTEKRPAVVHTLFDKLWHAIDVKTFKIVRQRGIPGPNTDRALVLGRDGPVAILRRGRRFFAIDLEANRIAWQGVLRWGKARFVNRHQAFFNLRKGPTLLPKKLPNPHAKALDVMKEGSCQIMFAEEKRWFCRNKKGLVVLDSKSGEVLARGRRATDVWQLGDLVIAKHPKMVDAKQKAQWVGLDLATGKPRWRVTDPGPEAALPTPFKNDSLWPARWSWAGAGLFLVADDGKCFKAVEQETGKPRFTQCFGALEEPPLLLDERTILIAARPARPGVDPKIGSPSKAADEKNLYAVDTATGAKRLVWSPGPGKRVSLGLAPVVSGVLYATVRPARGQYRKNTVIALDLYGGRASAPPKGAPQK